MPALKNTRHERFAQELAKGRTQEQAYEAAGYRPSRPNASKLASGNNIIQRVAQIQERGAVRAEITIAALTEKLARYAEKLEAAGMPAAAHDSDGDAVPSAVSHQHINVARACVMDIAKLNGMIVDKSARANVSIEDLLKGLDDES